MEKSSLVNNLPEGTPAWPATPFRFADIAVTATAKDFAGIYRGKRYHESDFESVLDRASQAGVAKVLLTGMSMSDIDFNLDIARLHSQQCSITVGVHPYHAAEPGQDPHYFNNMFARVDSLLQVDRPHLVALGELGLDYDHLEWASKETQTRVFRAQLDCIVSAKYDLPLFLHCRAAFDDFVQVIEPYLNFLPRKGVVHSFVGSVAQMQQLIGMGFDISINGFSFRDRHSIEMVAALPLTSLQLETDAPWGLVPPSSDVSKRYLGNAPAIPASKKRDKYQEGHMVKDRNESCTISRIALIVAGVKGISVDEVANSAWHNSHRMFWPSE